MNRPRVLLPADVWGSCLVAEMQLTRAAPALLRERNRMVTTWRPVPPRVVGLPHGGSGEPERPGRVA